MFCTHIGWRPLTDQRQILHLHFMVLVPRVSNTFHTFHAVYLRLLHTLRGESLTLPPPPPTQPTVWLQQVCNGAHLVLTALNLQRHC